MTGIVKLGSSRGWTWYTSKRSRSYSSSADSSKREREKSNLAESTMRSPAAPKPKNHKVWLKTTETEMTGPYEEVHSPISPLDNPLPPSYSPRRDEDVGYHTWSWNLLSRPRNEKNAPKLTRSPTARDSATPWKPPNVPSVESRTTVSGRKPKENSSLPRSKIHIPSPDESLKPRSQLDSWSSVPRTAKATPSRPRSLVPGSISDNDSRASPSSLPTRHVSQCAVRQRSGPVSPDGSFIVPSRPRPIARIESNERITPPKLKIRTQNNTPLPPTPPSKITSPSSYTSQHQGFRDGAVSRAEEPALPRMRSDSGETVWPHVIPEITREEVEDAIFRGHAM